MRRAISCPPMSTARIFIEPIVIMSVTGWCVGACGTTSFLTRSVSSVDLPALSRPSTSSLPVFEKRPSLLSRPLNQLDHEPPPRRRSMLSTAQLRLLHSSTAAAALHGSAAAAPLHSGRGASWRAVAQLSAARATSAPWALGMEWRVCVP